MLTAVPLDICTSIPRVGPPNLLPTWDVSVKEQGGPAGAAPSSRKAAHHHPVTPQTKAGPWEERTQAFQESTQALLEPQCNDHQRQQPGAHQREGLWGDLSSHCVFFWAICVVYKMGVIPAGLSQGTTSCCNKQPQASETKCSEASPSH